MPKTLINSELQVYQRSSVNSMVLVKSDTILNQGDEVEVCVSETMFFDAEEKGFLASKFFRDGEECFFIKSNNVKRS